ncbi:P25-alpha [Trinorchestia longiramus]|nr:P25-alpha [Trinorchestia longiramus]
MLLVPPPSSGGALPRECRASARLQHLSPLLVMSTIPALTAPQYSSYPEAAHHTNLVIAWRTHTPTFRLLCSSSTPSSDEIRGHHSTLKRARAPVWRQMKIAYPDYEKYLQDLAKSKNQDLAAIKGKLKNCGTPGLRGTTSVVKNSAVDRLTNTQKYTGSHKQRFDAEGKGKGATGRKDVEDKSGYVAGYKNKDSYAKTH